ncbi:MAG: hypothetical protein H0W40_13695 [Methylibium sp.]|uniref:histidine kinase dimerization/phospho-acceptor domain-containing protein n=1 Tax=Methylibium sp. TaxID=2067992 RepID=UPI0017D582D1|nr:histidine kinase dimerization/phospho-acceptor domain-containing protein [Methylibium sp.]MBA3598410.1 hypothetical protein [Methylibium sp.]
MRSNTELDAFCASVSHDLRTPLGHVTGFIELLQQSTAGKLSATEERYMQFIHQGALRMMELIGDFLRFARLDSLAMQCDRVDMGACVKEAIGR